MTAAAADPSQHQARSEKTRKEITQKIKRKVTDDDLYAYLMYPKVFLDFQQHHKAHGKVGALPTLNFLYGLQAGEEIQVSIEEGKDLFIRLITIGSPDEMASAPSPTLNGMAKYDDHRSQIAPKRLSEPRPMIRSFTSGAPIPA